MLGSREVTTRGIVISRTSRGEGSVRVSLYTEEFGLIWAVARSAREERSKLRPHLQIGTYGVYTLVKGATDWRVVGAVKTNNTYFGAHTNTAAQQSVNRVLGVVRQLMHGEETDVRLFESLWQFISHVTALSPEFVVLGERVVLATILFQNGYIPEQHIPSLTISYTEEALSPLKDKKKEFTKAINEGFVASGLLN